MQFVERVDPLVLLRFAIHQHKLGEALRAVIAKHRGGDLEDARHILLASVYHVALKHAAYVEVLISLGEKGKHKERTY